jgi:hypothetical protein
MSILEGPAARLLRDCGYTIYAPGGEPKSLLKSDMVDILAGAGFVVLPPSQPVPAEFVSLPVALQVVREAGFVAISRSETAPALGPWVPHKAIHARREAVAIDGVYVVYRQDGDLRRCKIGTFHAWRRKFEAVLVTVTDGPAAHEPCQPGDTSCPI